MKKLLPLMIIFIAVALLLMVFRKMLQSHDFDVAFLHGANLLIFVVTILGYLIIGRTSRPKIPQSATSGVYASFILKFFVIIAALFIYLSVSNEVNRQAIFTSMGLYILYSFTEVYLLLKSKSNPG